MTTEETTETDDGTVSTETGSEVVLLSYQQLVRPESQTRELSRLLALSKPQTINIDGGVETARVPSAELVEALAPLAAVDVENILKTILNNDALDEQTKQEYIAEIVMAQPYHSYVLAGYDEHNADLIALRKDKIARGKKDIIIIEAISAALWIPMILGAILLSPRDLGFSIGLALIASALLAPSVWIALSERSDAKKGHLKRGLEEAEEIHELHRLAYDHSKNRLIARRQKPEGTPPVLSRFFSLSDADRRRFLRSMDRTVLHGIVDHASISQINDFINEIPKDGWGDKGDGSCEEFRSKVRKAAPFPDSVLGGVDAGDLVSKQRVLASDYYSQEEVGDPNGFFDFSAPVVSDGIESSLSTMKPVSTLSIESVRSDYGDAMKRISSYETDINKALKYPAFNDISTPEVKDMVRQMRTCRRMLSAANEHTVSEIAAAVDDLWVEVHSAEKAAENLSWSSMTDEEKADLELAQQLIAQARDSGNTEPMRATFYAKLNDVIHRLNKQRTVVPAPVVGEIEHRARKMLTATASTEDNVNAVENEKVDEHA